MIHLTLLLLMLLMMMRGVVQVERVNESMLRQNSGDIDC